MARPVFANFYFKPFEIMLRFYVFDLRAPSTSVSFCVRSARRENNVSIQHCYQRAITRANTCSSRVRYCRVHSNSCGSGAVGALTIFMATNTTLISTTSLYTRAFVFVIGPAIVSVGLLSGFTDCSRSDHVVVRLYHDRCGVNYVFLRV